MKFCSWEDRECWAMATVGFNGNRWVPLNLETIAIVTDRVGVPHSLGFKVSLPGFIADPPGSPSFPVSYPNTPFWRYFVFEDTENAQGRQCLVKYDSSSDRRTSFLREIRRGVPLYYSASNLYLSLCKSLSTRKKGAVVGRV